MVDFAEIDVREIERAVIMGRGLMEVTLEKIRVVDGMTGCDGAVVKEKGYARLCLKKDR